MPTGNRNTMLVRDDGFCGTVAHLPAVPARNQGIPLSNHTPGPKEGVFVVCSLFLARKLIRSFEQFCTDLGPPLTVACSSNELGVSDMAFNENAEWDLVAAQVAKETDSEKLTELAAEFNRILNNDSSINNKR
jgi:hypothetical protein